MTVSGMRYLPTAGAAASPRPKWGLRVSGVSVVALVLCTSAMPAQAVVPPPAVIAAAPADTVGPERPMRKNNDKCVDTGVLANSNLLAKPAAANTLRLDRAHESSTGAGVTVAVISTGVRPQPRLPGLLPGGDYVVESDRGLADCDGTGTFVAGIIGAKASPTDGFVGVAPDARILSIRIESGNYQPQTVDNDNDNPNNSRQAIVIRAMARAIVRAANQNAKVIVVPAPICLAANKDIDQRALGGALAFAASKDATVVTGAGASGRSDGGTSSSCRNNPDGNPGKPDDPRGWSTVETISTPGWFDPQVLTVGAVSGEGIPLESSMLGPWIDAAAPGSGLVSLSPNRGDGVVNAVQTEKGLSPFAGPELSAAFVAGTLALVRSRWPQLSAREAAARVIATAHNPGGRVDNAVGNGLIDPVAALTATVPDMNADATPESVAQLIKPPPPLGPDTTPRTVAALSVAAAAGLCLLLGAVLLLRGRRRPRTEGRS